MSAISSSTAGSLLPWLTELSPQSPTATNPADALLASEAESGSQTSQAPQSNILAAIAALSASNSALSQNAGTQDTLAAFLGSLEQNDPAALGAAAGTDAAATSTASITTDLNAIANSNDTSSQQAAIAQLLASDGIDSNQLQMDFLTAVLGSSNPTSATNTDSNDLFADLSQNAATDSPLNILA